MYPVVESYSCSGGGVPGAGAVTARGAGRGLDQTSSGMELLGVTSAGAQAAMAIATTREERMTRA